MTFTVAHITDVHLGPIEGFAPRYWSLKRGLGYLNWVRKRRHDHRRAVLDRLVEDLARQRPDHIAVTGDLTNIGLPQEHSNALSWLEGLGPPDRVSVVPGNHDAYTRRGHGSGIGLWAAYMASNAEGAVFAHRDAGTLPFVRVIGDVALVGLSSAVPTPPLMAWGRIGQAQLGRLGVILARLRTTGLFRLVLVHHPPLRDQASAASGLYGVAHRLRRAGRSLHDAAGLEAVLAQGGAELVIHGHNHRNMMAWLPCAADAASVPASARGRIAVVGAPSGSQGRAHGREALARYNLYRIARSAPERPGLPRGPWQAEMVGRGLAEPDGPVVELERRALTFEAGS